MRKKKVRIVHVGVDIGKDNLDVAWRGLEGELNEFQVTNDAEGHAELARRVTSGRIQEARVVLESTGPYGILLMNFLAKQPRLKFMMVQPRAARAYAVAAMRRAKTDRVDARVLCEFAARMDFVPTVLPDLEIVRIRGFARHLGELVDRRTAIKNQRHAAKAAGEVSGVLLRAMDREEEALGEIIDELEREVITALKALPLAARAYERLVKIQGIKVRAVARLLPELLAMPRQLTPREAVAFAGLDPRPHQSGSSARGVSWPISKQGNSRIRRSLYMAALVAIRYFQPVREQYERLRERGKPKKVALVAAMRKLLTAIWAMVARDEDFDQTKWSGIRVAAT